MAAGKRQIERVDVVAELDRARTEGRPADFRWCEGWCLDLRGLNFEGADLRWSYWMQCDLEGACFDGARVDHARFAFCAVEGAVGFAGRVA